jgi:hypothetical protein
MFKIVDTYICWKKYIKWNIWTVAVRPSHIEDARFLKIKEWYNRFKDGRTSVESDARSGRPSASGNDELIDLVRTLVMQDHRVTVRELAEEVGISTGSVHSILTDDLSMWRLSVKRDSCILTKHQLIPCNWFKTFLAKHNIPWFDRPPNGSLRFLAVLPPENMAERYSIWVMRRYYTEHDGQAVLHSQRGISEMLRTMAEPLGEVCSVTRRLLRRGLGLQTSRHVNIFFLAKGWILFEQPSYSLLSAIRLNYSYFSSCEWY